jgi:hypothetical protein
MIDTHKIVTRLQAAGSSQVQAEAIAESLRETVEMSQQAEFRTPGVTSLWSRPEHSTTNTGT